MVDVSGLNFTADGPHDGAGGEKVYKVRGVYQKGEALLRTLSPAGGGEQRRVVWVLPVEPGAGEKFGDGLGEVRALGLHDRYGFSCVAPAFSDWPWYCDHPTDPCLRQESHVLEAVLPVVRSVFPHARAQLLVGFSKSGFGAVSLLLRHPEIFHAASVWDAILSDQATPGDMERIFGTSENYRRYSIGPACVRGARALGDRARLALAGHDLFGEHLRETHALLGELGVPHLYADGPRRKHRWDSGWLEGAFASLDAMAGQL